MREEDLTTAEAFPAGMPALGQQFFDSAEDDEAPGEASRRAAAAQDDLAAAGRQREKERETPGVVRSHETHTHSEEFNGACTGRGTRCCAGVYDCGGDAALYLRAKTPPTQKQLLHLLKLAHQKGWDELYVYDSKENPNLGVAMQLDQLATACLLKPYGKTMLEKRICREMQGITICKTPAQYQAVAERTAEASARLTGEKSPAETADDKTPEKTAPRAAAAAVLAVPATMG